MNSHTALAPAVVVLPLALLTVLVVATHGWFLLGNNQMPRSRRSIRLANTAVMLMAAPTLAYAFGVATPEQPRAFTLAWVLSIWLLLMVLILAAADSLNTIRLFRKERAEFLSGPRQRPADSHTEEHTSPPRRDKEHEK